MQPQIASVLGLLFCFLTANLVCGQDEIRDAVVKIHTTRRPPDFLRPWTKSQAQKVSGSGVVIDGNRILTNAHVVSYQSSIYVQAHQSSKRKKAKVLGVSPEMDLAVLTVDDESFFEDRPTLELTSEIPKLKDVVNVYGFPIGGEQMSITEGIVSRIESVSYALDGYGLRIQVDAALNPGNSGGPAIADGKILGLVFSGIRNADNIGYLIPAQEVVTFLQDVEDGTYDGKPRLFGRFQTVENEALRERLKLSNEQGGMMINQPTSDDEDYPLKEYDVITHVGEFELDRQGNIQIDEDLKLAFHYAVPQLAKDGKVPLSVWRDGKKVELEVPVKINKDWLIKPLRGTYPPYFVYGPMLFTTASQDLLARLRGGGATMLNLRENPMIKRRFDPPAFEGEELVLLGARLFPHRLTEGYDPQFFAAVEDINGVKIKNLKHLVETLRDHDEEFLEIHLGGNYETLVFNKEELSDSVEEILEDEGIRSQLSEDLEEIWEAK